ncbi:MAG: hypothetical protein JXR76_09215 [Deltaproteobacteria bacterium]|nr:hypothetical protein [Deltaproteobacteria bacterium]
MTQVLLDISSLLANVPLSPIALILLLIFVGEILLGLEVFVIPGFGAGGILGVIALISAAVVAGSTYGVLWGVTVFVASGFLSFVGVLLGMKSKMIQKRFVLDTTQQRGSGTAHSFGDLVGKRGVAITALRPAGTARIENRRLDVVTEGGFIDVGSPVEVTLIDGPRVVVRQVEQNNN